MTLKNISLTDLMKSFHIFRNLFNQFILFVDSVQTEDGQDV